MSKYSEVTLENILVALKAYAITKVIVNKKVIWDDDSDPWISYEAAISKVKNKDSLVDKFTFNIVHFHHFEVNINTL